MTRLLSVLPWYDPAAIADRHAHTAAVLAENGPVQTRAQKAIEAYRRESKALARGHR
jgi:hypothetical protein